MNLSLLTINNAIWFALMDIMGIFWISPVSEIVQMELLQTVIKNCVKFVALIVKLAY